MKRRIEEHREEGQALLRSMVVTSTEVDWNAVITKANELHTQEQEWLKDMSNRHERSLFMKRQKKALRHRKQYDAVGSFSVNLLTYRMDEEKRDRQNPFRKSKPISRAQSAASGGSSPSTWQSRDDDQSNLSDATDDCDHSHHSRTHSHCSNKGSNHSQPPSSRDMDDNDQPHCSNDTDNNDKSSHCSSDTDACVQSCGASEESDCLNVLDKIVGGGTMDLIDEETETS